MRRWMLFSCVICSIMGTFTYLGIFAVIDELFYNKPISIREYLVSGSMLFVAYFILLILSNRFVRKPTLNERTFVKLLKNLYYILFLSGNCKRVRPKS